MHLRGIMAGMPQSGYHGRERASEKYPEPCLEVNLIFSGPGWCLGGELEAQHCQLVKPLLLPTGPSWESSWSWGVNSPSRSTYPDVIGTGTADIDPLACRLPEVAT